jgi:hypothetical protein
VAIRSVNERHARLVSEPASIVEAFAPLLPHVSREDIPMLIAMIEQLATDRSFVAAECGLGNRHATARVVWLSVRTNASTPTRNHNPAKLTDQ